jgi:hypothetical protein
MKDKDYNMLQEAYTQVNELKHFNEYEEPVRISDYVQQKELDLGGYGVALIDDGETVITPYIDPSDYPDMMVSGYGKQAWVVNDPSKKGWYVRIHTGGLETNPEQAGYKRKPKMQDKPNISSLSKQDPREVQGYGRTFGEDKEWHNLGAKTGPAPDMGDVLRSAKPMNPEDMDKPDIQQEFVDFVDKYSLNYDELAKAVAQLLKNEYGSHNFIPFMSVLNRELKQSKE